jgi:starvation-inducible DNA-binding protein
MNAHVNCSLSDEARECVGGILNHALADEFALSSATRDYHWNVSGPNFRSLNELFDGQYRDLDRWIERIVERARALGVTALSGWTELINAPRFTPRRGADLTASTMLAVLIELHDLMARQLDGDATQCAAECGDNVTSELLRELVEYHETTAWVLGELLEDCEFAQAS